MADVVLPDWPVFRPRLFPSCHFAWLAGPRPVLVDSGFGSDLDATLGLLPDEPALVFNTHWHSDHLVGKFALMIHGGFARSEVLPYLLARRWVHDFGPLAGLPPEEFAERMVSDLAGSGAARWERECLISSVPHTPRFSV